MVGDKSIDSLGTHVSDNIIHSLGVHDVGTLLVNDPALVIHDVVIFDHLLADVVVARLHIFLGGFDGLRQPFGTDRLTIAHILVHHQGDRKSTRLNTSHY